MKPPLRIMDMRRVRDTNQNRTAQTVAERKPVSLGAGQRYDGGKVCGDPKPMPRDD